MGRARVAYFVIIGTLMFLTSCHSNNTKRSPNILFLMSDQHRGDALGADGNAFVKTPNLDNLAREGLMFRRAYSSVPSCLPARTAILTGMSPWASGLLGYKPIVDYPFEGPAIFSENGYRTHAVGKNHFSPMRHKHGYQSIMLEEGWYTDLENQEKCDYTIWFEENYPDMDINESGLGYVDHRGGRIFPFEEKAHPTHWTADQAIEFLETYDGKDPWLLKVSFQRPHPPFDPPEKWAELYQEADIDLPKVGNWADEKYGQNLGSLEATPNATNGVFPVAEIISSKRSYYAALSYVDEQIGRLLELLKKRNEYRNTFILYTSDHGDMMGDHHMWRKCRPYEGSTRIPMIIRWPESMGLKIKRGSKSDALVELRDVFPTFFDVAGIPKPEVMDGISMIRVLKGVESRDILDLEHALIYEPDNAWVALTDNRYKYIYFTLTGEEQLFDLINDPYEQNNLAGSQNQKIADVESWRQKMIEHLRIRGDAWVRDGELQIQDSSLYYGKNHPSLSNQDF